MQQQQLQHRLWQAQPDTTAQQSELNTLMQRAARATTQQLQRQQQQWQHQCSQLQQVSPLATLARGYSVVTTGDGQLIRSVEQVTIGVDLTITLPDGRLQSQVTAVMPKA